MDNPFAAPNKWETRLFKEDGSPVNSVAIIGMGPSMQSYLSEVISQDQKNAIADEIWTINLSSMALRADRIIWMDDLQHQMDGFAHCIQKLRELDTPVVCPMAHPDLVPKSVAYPIQEIALKALEFFGRVYLNNSVAYAIAYAHVMGVKMIKLYGCDFTYKDWNHAEKGRACVEAWLVSHVAKGGDVALPTTTSLFDEVHGHELYGYVEQPEIKLPDGGVLRHAKIGDRAQFVYIPKERLDAESSSNGSVRAPLPGTERAGSERDGGVEVGEPAEASPDPSGEGLRDSDSGQRAGDGTEAAAGEGTSGRPDAGKAGRSGRVRKSAGSAAGAVAAAGGD